MDEDYFSVYNISYILKLLRQAFADFTFTLVLTLFVSHGHTLKIV